MRSAYIPAAPDKLQRAQRRRDGETERQRDRETERRIENFVSPPSCPSVSPSLCPCGLLYPEPVSHENDQQSDARHPSWRPQRQTVNTALGWADSRFRRSENPGRVSAAERLRRRLFVPRSNRGHALENGGRDVCDKRPVRVLAPDVSIHLRHGQPSLRPYVLCGEAGFGALRDGGLPARLSDQSAPDESSPAFIAGVRAGLAQPAAHSLFVLRPDRHSA